MFAGKKTTAAAWKTSTSLLHVRQIQKRFGCRKKCAYGSLEELTQLIACQKNPGTFCCPKKSACGRLKDLTQLVIFQRNHNASVAGKESACGSLEDLTQLITCQKIQERLFCRTKKSLRQPGRPHPTYSMSDRSRNTCFAGKKAPAGLGRLH